MVKAKKAAVKGIAAERSRRTSTASGVPKVTPQPPSPKKAPAKKVAAIRKQVEEKGKEEQEQRHEEALLLDLGGQRQRWVNFVKEQSLSTEEAAKLLLDSFEYKGLVKHSGGCHCGSVRFEVWASSDLHIFDCNCSICVKKQNRHFIVPASRFKLLKGADNLTTYKFNTKKAQHTFCKTCGVQSFYTPRSNPDGYGISPHCLDEGTVRSVHVEQINGKEWEKMMKEHKTIRSMSQS
ncbi:centromere protein V L homeolog [Xenopus laevis]|uniref:Centromere protein V L homeolog n=2 Tax=Xenopus laevis TaxID=8355 RepID=Q0IHI8_XENLA|nr:centromere protein V L homeolog [Xenopus laevis]AAI23138.1 MGC154325 protein [Xenopus laevis]OCT93986.1 hypothetical protein XELAEV_18011649mg [Xenopus laevis]